MTTSNTLNKTTFVSIDEAVTYMNTVSLAERMVLKKELPTAKSAKSVDIVEAMIDGGMISICPIVVQDLPNQPTSDSPVNEEIIVENQPTSNEVLPVAQVPVIAANPKKDAKVLLAAINAVKSQIAKFCDIATKQNATINTFVSAGMPITSEMRTNGIKNLVGEDNLDFTVAYEVNAQFAALLKAGKIKIGDTTLTQEMIDGANAVTISPADKFAQECVDFEAALQLTAGWRHLEFYFAEVRNSYEAFCKTHEVDPTYTVSSSSGLPIFTFGKTRKSAIATGATEKRERSTSKTVAGAGTVLNVNGEEIVRPCLGGTIIFSSTDKDWSVVATDMHNVIKFEKHANGVEWVNGKSPSSAISEALNVLAGHTVSRSVVELMGRSLKVAAK